MLLTDFTLKEVWLHGFEQSIDPSKRKKWQKLAEAYIFPELGNRQIRTICDWEINLLLSNTLKVCRSTYKTDQVRMILDALYKYAQKHLICAENPVLNVKRIKPDPKLIRPFTTGQVLTLLQAMEDLEWKNLFRFQLYTGLLFAEISQIRVSRVNIREGMIQVGSEHTSFREISIVPQAMECLQDEMEQRTIRKEHFTEAKWNDSLDLLFTLDGSFLEKKNLMHDINIIKKKTGILDYSFQRSRENFMAQALRNGAGPKDLQLYFGQAATSYVLRNYLEIMR